MTKSSEIIRDRAREGCNKLRAVRCSRLAREGTTMNFAQSASFKITAILVLVFLSSSCGKTTDKPSTPSASETKPSRPPADHGGLQNQPMIVPADNPITPEKVALGKQLFFDSR